MISFTQHLFVRLTGVLLLVLLLATLLPSIITYAERMPNDVSDFCDEALDSSFCEEQSKVTNGSDAINNTSSPILGPSSILYKIIQTLTVLTGAVSVIMIIVGGFRYVVSGGDSSATKGAKDTILYAVVGLVVVIFAQTIITFVLSRL